MSLSFGVGKDRFYSSLCPVSLKSDELQPCAQCQMVRYSSVTAAQTHWPLHSPICRILTKMIKASGGKNPLDKNPGGCVQLAGIVKMCLRRNLKQFESDLLTYPRLCSQCYSHLTNCGVSCPRCDCAVYCDQECQELNLVKHNMVCDKLRHNKEDFIYWQTKNLKEEVDIMMKRSTLSLTGVTDMSEVLLRLGMSSDTPTGRAMSSALSSPLTVSLALPWIDKSQDAIIIHLVGSRKIETSNLTAWSLLCKMFNRDLSLVHIGPEACGPDGEDQLCHGGVSHIFVPPCTYADYAKSSTYLEPNIVCAFNCGFILYNSWAESIPFMLRESGAPLLFTEYYQQDCCSNLSLVEELVSVTQLMQVRENPFQSLVYERSPVVMWGGLGDRFGREEVVQDNMNVAVVRRREEQLIQNSKSF